jgi:alanyl-tRNA synthetase
LREVLGNGIEQKGSLVSNEKLRFDFSHKSAVADLDLARVEDLSTQYIRRNCIVYSQEVPLAIARKIAGVRAVFGETYPDPVRVVSVGVKLDDILENVEDKRWEDVSIEFCGGTHVQKTGDIKDLVILEESGIAKGIRRIIAVTGEDAHKVQRVAADFEKRLDYLETMPSGPVKEQNAKQIQVELNQLSISAIQKSKFRERFTHINKKIIEEQKTQQKLESKKAVESITSYFEAPENSAKSWLIAKLPISANARAISESLTYVKTKLADKTVYVLAPSIDDGRVAHGCYVSKVSAQVCTVWDLWNLTHHNLHPQAMSEQGASASEWATAVSRAVGGKAGGKGPTSIGNGVNPDKVDDAIDLASEYLSKFKL